VVGCCRSFPLRRKGLRWKREKNGRPVGNKVLHQQGGEKDGQSEQTEDYRERNFCPVKEKRRRTVEGGGGGKGSRYVSTEKRKSWWEEARGQQSVMSLQKRWREWKFS